MLHDQSDKPSKARWQDYEAAEHHWKHDGVLSPQTLVLHKNQVNHDRGNQANREQTSKKCSEEAPVATSHRNEEHGAYSRKQKPGAAGTHPGSPGETAGSNRHRCSKR